MVHMDDCTIAATKLQLIDEFKAGMKQDVDITDLGELHWLLSIKIHWDHKKCTTHLLQCSYIDLILC